MQEEWRPVVGFEGLYEVSNIGRIRSSYKNTRNKSGYMKFKKDTGGYYRVNLHKDKQQHSYLVSRLVAMAFLPNPNGLPMVGHEDNNKCNNAIFNLYWTDADENSKHDGQLDRFHKSHNKKIKQIADKLSIGIEGTNMITGEKIYFNSMQEAERNGFLCSKISNCCSGKNKSHRGYTWKKIMK